MGRALPARPAYAACGDDPDTKYTVERYEILSVVEREWMTWNDVGTAVEELAKQIEGAGLMRDAVLALARGVLPAAGALA